MKKEFEQRSYSFEIRAEQNEDEVGVITGRPIVYNSRTDLILINPFTGWINNDADQYSDTYANVKRTLAELYGLPLLDLTKRSGFNALNRSTFYCDDMTQVTYRLHLNDAGNEVIGKIISNFVGGVA